MTEIGTLTSIRDAYAKRIEECHNKLIELQLEISHCTRMKDCYDYLINMRGGDMASICSPSKEYIDTDIAITKSLVRVGDEDEY